MESNQIIVLQEVCKSINNLAFTVALSLLAVTFMLGTIRIALSRIAEALEGKK